MTPELKLASARLADAIADLRETLAETACFLAYARERVDHAAPLGEPVIAPVRHDDVPGTDYQLRRNPTCPPTSRNALSPRSTPNSPQPDQPDDNVVRKPPLSA